MDARIRQRRLEVLRHQGRRRLRLVVAAGATVVLLVAGLGALRSPLLAVRNVHVVGARQTPVGEVVSASGLGGHPLMVNVDASAVARRVEALPWVGAASVVRRWPSTVDVSIAEREVLGQIEEAPGRWVLVDASGRVLAGRRLPEPGVLELAEPGGVGPPGSFLGPAAAPALLVATTLPPELRSHVSAVVTAAGGVDVSLVPVGTAVLGAPTELGAKYETLLTVLAEVSMAGVKVVDLRVPADPALTRG